MALWVGFGSWFTMELTLLGSGLGLAAGLSPGPLLTLLVAVSVERGFRAGSRIAVAPLLSDLPIVLLALLLLKDLSASWLGTLTLLGGLFVAYLGAQSLKRRAPAASSEAGPAATARDLWHGAAVNFLNPHPWIFWMSVGTPTLVSGWRQQPWDAVGYLAGFYLFLVGSKMVLAWLAAEGGHALGGPWFAKILELCGWLLLLLGCLLCYRGSVQLWTAAHPAAEPPPYLM
jgi:threonine/homoserine/homoserine lactone efflux protein